MRDENTKKSKLSWSKNLVRKWFNIKSKTEEFQADEVVYGGGDVEWRKSFSEREQCTVKKSRREKLTKSTERVRRRRVDLDHPQIINVHNYSMFVATWNVGGKPPSNNLDLDDFLHSAPPADIYVLGFQEIVPLNAGNILGAEDNGPAKKWLSLIRKTLNNLPGSSGSGCYTPSPIPNPIAESDVDFEGSTRHKSSFLPRRSFQTPSIRRENDPRLDRRYSVCDRYIFGHRPSDYDPSSRSGHRPSDYDPSSRLGHRPSDYDHSSRSGHRASDYDPSSRSGHRPSDYDLSSRSGRRASDASFSQRASDASFGHRPSDFGHRPSDFSWGNRPSISSRWGSSDEDFWAANSPSTVLYEEREDGDRRRGNSRYCLVASKQMVGILLTVWVKSDLREHVRNMKVSCVGRGLMGYLGNKGSISVSMLLHQTSFCFVCTHLTSGQKEGDELRRNADVIEILRKTRFPRVKATGEDKLPEPETILEHDRVIWLGDLNYRVALSYRTAKALVEMQNWRALLENDQLRLEQRRGRVFHGWKEGRIYFPPTYKYSDNSDRYSGDAHPKEKRRTPAWCDRVLWHGRGLHQLSYVRGESRFSDHRPVYSIFWAEVESYQGRLRKSMSSSRSRIEVEELLPYSHGYTELCFF